MNILITGRPGSGKSTVVSKVVETLKRRGWIVGGVICPDIRDDGIRTGFRMVDLMTGTSGNLSNTVPSSGPKVGRYYVNLSELDAIGAVAIRRAVSEADLVVIDEIGFMELKSVVFQAAVEEALRSEKNLLAVVHQALIDRFSFGSTRLLEVGPKNRDELAKTITELFLSLTPTQSRSSNVPRDSVP